MSNLVPQDIAPQLETWKEEAVEALARYQVDAWREWAPQWLVPSLFAVGPAGASGSQKSTLETRIDMIEQAYEKGMEETMMKMERGELSVQEAQLLSQQIGELREDNLKQVKDFAQWEVGNVDEEDEVVSGKGKGREVEKEKEKEKEEETEMAPQGWRPDEGAQVRPVFFSLL